MTDISELIKEGATKLKVEVSEAQAAQLAEYIQLLAKWNKAYNLTAIRDPEEMVQRHLWDSFGVMGFLGVPPLPGPLPMRERELSSTNLLDLGTGAGLPGIVIAILRPDIQVTLLDSVGKKIRFLNQVVAELNLPNAHPVHARAEAYRPGTPMDIITARAVATVPELIRLSQHMLTPGGQWLLMKGEVPEDELSTLMLPYSVHTVEVPGADKRCVVVVNLSNA